MSNRLVRLFIFSLCAILLAGSASIQAAYAKPLLQEGKKELYQRVVSHPEACLYESADEKSTVVNGNLRAFTPLYVYERNGNWLNVGKTTNAPDGWIAADKTTAWDQAMTLLFTNRSERDPVLFFKTEGDLNALCSAQDMEQQLAAMQAGVAKGQADDRIMAAEPSASAVNSKSFYLMPILQTKEPFEGTKFLKVASINPGSKGSKTDTAGKDGKPRTGIAIVIDTTISMGPYIDQCKSMVKGIFDKLAQDKLTDHVGLAIVAFRNSTDASPKVEYTTKIISDFVTVENRAQLENSLKELNECKASTHSYAEDSLAGVYVAAESLSWQDYDSRIILLVTDAGPLPPTDRYRSVFMEPRELNDYTRKKGIWTVVVHVKSPSGKKDHESAQKAYQELSLVDGKSQYQTVKTDNAKQGALYFRRVGEAMAKTMASMVSYTAEGRLITRPKNEAAAAQKQDTPEDMADRIGYAMQLDFLGRANKTNAPEVVSSWITDMDLQRLAQGQHVPNVEVAVMLTKAQLSDLSDQVQTIVDNAERTKKSDAKDFFQGILSASAKSARDPNAPTSGKTLAELGVLGEFLDGLPYKSAIMDLTEDDWYRKSVGEQTAFINRLKSKLVRYQEYDADKQLWESFGVNNANERVCRIPLDMLP